MIMVANHILCKIVLSVVNFLNIPLLTSETKHTTVCGPIAGTAVMNLFLRKPVALIKTWEFTVTTARRKIFCWRRITEPVVTRQI